MAETGNRPMRQARAKAGLWLRMVCAVALLSVAFAPHSTPLATPALAFSEAYRLPDGSFADLCEDHGYGDPGHQRVLRCEVCLLCASAMLPAPDSAHWLLTIRRIVDNPLRHPSVVEETRAIPAPRSRAPPTLV
jgi:hypothetical protein